MTCLRALSVLFLTSACLRADLVLVQDVDAMGQKLTMTLKTKGTLIRMDLNPQMSVIVDSTNGEVKTLMHDQKMVMTMNIDAMKGMMPSSLTASGTSKAAPVIKPLGKMEKINGYDTEEYLFTQGDVSSHLWIAKDHPQFAAFVQAMDVMRKGPIGQISPQLQMDMTQLPGLPMKSVLEMNGKAAGTSVVKSVEEKELDPAEFIAPADYKPLSMPTIPAPSPEQ